MIPVDNMGSLIENLRCLVSGSENSHPSNSVQSCVSPRLTSIVHSGLWALFSKMFSFIFARPKIYSHEREI